MAGIGFIGLGTMGRPMARHVLAARPEDRVVVNNRSRGSAEALEASGAVWAATPAELAAQVSMAVLVVPTIHEIRALTFGPDGLLAGAGDTLLLVVSSTCSSAEVVDLDTETRAASDGRVRVVDAPVSGGGEGAEAGTLAVMVGGSDADAAAAVEVLSACGRAVHLGPLGAGQVAKACNQLIVASTVVATAEAAVVAERAGLDVRALFDLLSGGYAASRVMEVKAPRYAAHDHSPSGPAKFMIKDLRSFAEEAARAGAHSFLTPTLQGVFGGLTEAGHGDLDTAVVQRWVEEQA